MQGLPSDKCLRSYGSNLVYVDRKLWFKSLLFNGKTRYFDWAMFNNYVIMLNYRRVTEIDGYTSGKNAL